GPRSGRAHAATPRLSRAAPLRLSMPCPASSHAIFPPVQTPAEYSTLLRCLLPGSASYRIFWQAACYLVVEFLLLPRGILGNGTQRSHNSERPLATRSATCWRSQDHGRDHRPSLGRAKFMNQHSGQGRGRGLDGSGARLALSRRAVASQRQIRAQHELAIETARLETAVRLGDLIEGDPLGDARPDSAGCQYA